MGEKALTISVFDNNFSNLLLRMYAKLSRYNWHRFIEFLKMWSKLWFQSKDCL